MKMSNDDGPTHFRRERNLSNRNFEKRGSRRRFSTESHSSVDNDSQTASVDNTQSTINSSSSSSWQLSYSVNSDTENGFKHRSILKMKTFDESNNNNGGAKIERQRAIEPQTPDPALMDVKQKVLRFETLQNEDQIIFKTGKFKVKPLPNLGNNNDGHLGPLRVLPVFKRRQNSDNETLDNSVTNSFHNSIDEERSEDEVDDFSDYAEDTNVVAAEYIVPEEAEELKEGITPSPLPGYNRQDSNTIGDNIQELGIDDFGKVESVRRAISVENSTGSRTPPTPIASTDLLDNLNHSSENLSTISDATDNNKGFKDFPRNYRTMPRPKTEIIGTKNRHLIGKYSSFHQPKDEDGAEEDEAIELRDKCDKFIHPILEELIKTEETYVDNLMNGIENYGNIFHRKDLPIGLRGKKYVLLGNIEQIAEFHRDEFLPMLHRNRRDLKRLFDEFQNYIDKNDFYGYVIFTMNKQRSLKLCDLHKNYFKLIQSELDDKLGINSFLVQPIQRMARYPLLLQQFITTLFKNRDFVMKPLIESCCRLEKKVRTLLTTTNESEVINDIVDCNEFNVFYQGKFRKVSDFHVFDHSLKRTYRSKVFIFDKCIIYTEIKGKNLVFHGRYPCEHIGIMAKTKSFTLFYQRRKQQECDFTADPTLIEMWLELIRDMINCFATEERMKLQERYSRENDHLHRPPPSLSLFRDSNRFSSDSGIGNIWVMPKPEVEETGSNRTTWYAVS